MPTTCFLSSSFSFILYPLSAFHLCVITSPTITQLYSIKVASKSLRIIRPRLGYQERYSQPLQLSPSLGAALPHNKQHEKFTPLTQFYLLPTHHFDYLFVCLFVCCSCFHSHFLCQYCKLTFLKCHLLFSTWIPPHHFNFVCVCVCVCVCVLKYLLIATKNFLCIFPLLLLFCILGCNFGFRAHVTHYTRSSLVPRRGRSGNETTTLGV